MQDFGAGVDDATDASDEPAINVDFGNSLFDSNHEWTGTEADLKLLGDSPPLGEVRVNTPDLSNHFAQGRLGLELDKPLKGLTLANPTDQSIAELTHLPKLRQLGLANSKLTPTGCRRLATLAASATQLSCPRR